MVWHHLVKSFFLKIIIKKNTKWIPGMKKNYAGRVSCFHRVTMATVGEEETTVRRKL